MKKIVSTAAVCLALGLALLLPSCKDESVNLRFKLGKGAKYHTASTTKMTMSLQFLNKPAAMSSEMRMESSNEVQDTGSGAKNLQLVYTRILLALTSPQGSYTYDSKDPASSKSPLADVSIILNKPVAVTMDERGHIGSVSGLSQVLSAAPGADPDVIAILRQSFNDTDLRNKLQQDMAVYPDGDVKPGDSWQRKDRMNLNGTSLATDDSYKLLSVKDGIAKVEVKGKLSMENGGQMMANVPASFTGQKSGTMEIEVSTGLVLKAVYTLELKGTVNQMGASAPVSVSAETTVESQRE